MVYLSKFIYVFIETHAELGRMFRMRLAKTIALLAAIGRASDEPEVEKDPQVDATGWRT